MPCPHNEISIVQRSQQQSAVAAAAYQSGEKLFCGYDQEVKHYPEKRGIVHNEILLPANAPRSYADRNTLWNAAEAVEKQWNSQLARRWVLTIPREIPPDQYAVLVREFCEQQFVSKGMIVDFAIHDPYPPGHNPHAHVLLTMRAMDEHGKWLPKSSKVYDLDEKGERIKLPSGRWKSHKEDTVDWNDQEYCEIWRHEWEVIQNRYLEANDRPERVDLRSYARQGLDIVPTVHEGAAVRQMEKRGIQTNIGNLNREIRAANRLMKSIRQLIQNLKGWITELGEKRKELLAQKAAEEATLLPNLLMKYMEIRKPLSYTQFQRVWKYIVTRSNKERTYVRYVNGQKIKHTVTPALGEKAPHNGKVVYSLDFQVTPHQLRHTYITNLIYAGVDPKTVQYLAGHENSKITMDIYAKVKYNSPDALSTIVNNAFNNMYAKAE